MKKKEWDARKRIDTDGQQALAEIIELKRQIQLMDMRLAALEMRPVFVQVQPGEAWKDQMVFLSELPKVTSIVYGGKI